MRRADLEATRAACAAWGRAEGYMRRLTKGPAGASVRREIRATLRSALAGAPPGVRYARDFEHVIIDTQARPSKDDLKLLAGGCDLLVLPTTPDSLSLEALLLTVGALRELNFDAFKILLTISPPKPSHDAEEARALLESELELPLFKSQVQCLVAYQRAALRGVPVYEVNDPRAAAAWEDYEQAGKEILP